MTHHARIVVGSTVLATLIACGPELAIRDVSPSSIGARTADFKIWVTGTGFTQQSVILLGGVEIKFGAGSAIGAGTSHLAALVPGGTVGTTAPGSVSVVVKNPDRSRSNEIPLVVTEAPAPVLSQLSAPNWCDGKDPVLLDVLGAHFTSDTGLELNGRALPISHLTDSSLRVSARRADLFPAGSSASFKVTVPAPGGGEAVQQFADPSFEMCTD